MDETPRPLSTMSDVRREVDRIDSELVALLQARFACMDAAARIKPSREDVRDEARKAEVIANVRRMAKEAGLPAERLANLWDCLVEHSIAHEYEQWDARRATVQD